MSNNALHETTLKVMGSLGLRPDPWQIDVITGEHQRLLLNCARQCGKTTVVAVLGLVEALVRPMTRVFLVSRSMRQSREMFRLMTHYHQVLKVGKLIKKTAEELQFENLSRIVCVPCNPETIRGFAAIDLLVIDEAARVPDELYRAVRPMLAVSGGRLIALSTPDGKRGWWHDAWARGGDDWTRIQIPADQCPRITPEFLDQERRALGEAWFRQEYFCSFESVEGVVYPDFARCVVRETPPHVQLIVNSELLIAGRSQNPRSTMNNERLTMDKFRCVGGIDFGFRNPFAALWGLRDRDDVLWLVGEHYARQRPLSFHAEHLPRHCTWYADPSGASEIAELRMANFTVRPGVNDLRLGIAAVSARLEDGSLWVLEGRCPNLLAEAGMYRWGPLANSRGEVPMDEHNHALAALRYLIAAMDGRNLAKRRRKPQPEPQTPAKTPEELALEAQWGRFWEWMYSDDERIWRRVG